MPVEEKVSVNSKLNRIIWLLNKKCNLKCKFCYVANRFRNDRELSLDEILKTLDGAVKLGVEKIDFTGGEVTLREDLDIILEETKKRGIETITINTNGTLLSEKMAEILARNNVKVYLSIDGADKKTHESIRGIGTWEKIFKSAELLKSFDITFYTVFACSKINISDVKGYIALSRELGSQKACIIPVLPIGRAKKDVILSREEFIDVLRQVESTAESIRFNAEIWCVPFAGLIISSPYVSYFGCRNLDEMDITPTGDVLVCDTVDISFGNVREGVEKVWRNLINSEMASNLLRTINSPPCSECIIKHICYGGCYARAKFLNGNIYAPDPMCPRVASF
ncbi:MAG: radical SAM protein [bacterium]|nr:radical SAM protein [bacterium]